MKTPTRAGYHWTVRRWQPTAAQQRVLEGVAAGESNPAIAARLGLSPETVKSHVAVLLAETGCTDRAELVQWWQGRQQVQVGGRGYGWLFRLALAALLLIGLALAAGLLVLLVAPGGARSRSLARRAATVTAPLPTPTAPAEAATAPAASATSFPPDPGDPASSPSGSGPVVFLWASPSGQLTFPQALAVDGQDNVYVFDAGNSRIVKFSPSGQLLTTWGSPGTADGQFTTPYSGGAAASLTIDGAGHVDVLDASGHLQQFDQDGTFLGRWPGGGIGSGPGQFDGPQGMVVDRQGRLYVADCGVFRPEDNRVQQFAPDGTPLASWGTKGTAPGAFNCPSGLALDANGNLYVVEHYNNRVQELDAQGNVVRQWGSFGRGPSQFNSPVSVAVDVRGNVYVTDNNGQRVEKFDAQGTFLGQWGSSGTGDGRFYYPAGIAIDSHGDIYIGDVLERPHPEVPPALTHSAGPTPAPGGWRRPRWSAVEARRGAVPAPACVAEVDRRATVIAVVARLTS